MECYRPRNKRSSSPGRPVVCDGKLQFLNGFEDGIILTKWMKTGVSC